MNRHPLYHLAGIPVDIATIATCYPHLATPTKRANALEVQGDLLRLKRGLYVTSPEVTGVPLSTELIANAIYGPSYVSMQTALRYWGLIPEAVYMVQSMTIKASRTFDNALGRFSYHQIGWKAFAVGITQQQSHGNTFLIATPEKALCDLVAQTAGLTLRYRNQALTYLTDFLRLDIDDFTQMKSEILEQYTLADGKKATSVHTLLHLLKSLQTAPITT